MSIVHPRVSSFFFFNDTATTEIYTLSLHDALPILVHLQGGRPPVLVRPGGGSVPEGVLPLRVPRSEEHTSELQSHLNLVCRLLLEKKKMQVNRQIKIIQAGPTILSADTCVVYCRLL